MPRTASSAAKVRPDATALPASSHTVLPVAFAAALRSGALAALGTWALVVLPSLVGWVAAPESSLGWFSATAIGSAIWFVGHAQSIGGAAVSISITPILLLLGFVLIARRSARRLVATQELDVRSADRTRLTLRTLAPGFCLGYLAIAAVVSLLTLGGPVAPGFAAVLGTLLVPALAMLALLLPPGQAVSAPLWDRMPSWAPAVWRAGWRGAWLLLGLGLAVVGLRVLLTLGTVLEIHGEYDVNVVAGAVLALAQVAFAGNLATWGLSFVAGPGFSVAVGGTVSPAAADAGLMPLVPVLGALPDDAIYPWAMWLVLALPVLAGVGIGRWVYRLAGWEQAEPGDADVGEPDDAADSDIAVARTRLVSRLLAVMTAGVLAVVVVGLLTALGNGSVGGDRLSAVGPPVGPLVGALLGEVVVGALLWVAWAAWQAHHPADAEDEAGEA